MSFFLSFFALVGVPQNAFTYLSPVTVAQAIDERKTEAPTTHASVVGDNTTTATFKKRKNIC
jgi:hypothetical protein